MQPRPRKEQPQVVLFLQHLLLSSGQPGQLPELQVQVPVVQTRLFVHACPHEPQLALSVCSLTHVAPHPVYPLLQAYVHAPPEQAGLALATPVVQAVGEPHWPVDVLHVSTLDPEHVV